MHVSRISMLRIEGHYGEAVRRGLSVLAEARHRGDIFTQARIGIFVLVDQQLLAGRFAEGRQVLRELSREWFRGRFPVQQVLGFFHDINIDLLLDRRGMAWRRCRRYWPLIERTQMLRVEVIRDYAFLLRGGTALAAIDDQPSQSSSADEGRTIRSAAPAPAARSSLEDLCGPAGGDDRAARRRAPNAPSS